MKTIQSNIAFIHHPDDNSKLLVYYDTDWDCPLFPNQRVTSANETANINGFRAYLSSTFDVLETDMALTLAGTGASRKFSPAHMEVRDYEYRLYNVQLAVTPSAWLLGAPFKVGFKVCEWDTVAEMLSDPMLQAVNGDVLALAEEYAK